MKGEVMEMKKLLVGLIVLVLLVSMPMAVSAATDSTVYISASTTAELSLTCPDTSGEGVIGLSLVRHDYSNTGQLACDVDSNQNYGVFAASDGLSGLIDNIEVRYDSLTWQLMTGAGNSINLMDTGAPGHNINTPLRFRQFTEWDDLYSAGGYSGTVLVTVSVLS
jgi:hypothetical protein